MKIELTEEGLKVGKFECESVTVYKSLDGNFRAELIRIKGYTERKFRINNFNRKNYYTVRIRKKIHSKTLDYSGIELEECPIGVGHEKFSKYLFAKNSGKNYINYYEVK